MARLVRTQREIDEVMNKAGEQMEEGSKFPGMSYEEGVRAALDWVLGVDDVDPMAD